MPGAMMLTDGRTLTFDSYGDPDGTPVTEDHGQPIAVAVRVIRQLAAIRENQRLHANPFIDDVKKLRTARPSDPQPRGTPRVLDQMPGAIRAATLVRPSTP